MISVNPFCNSRGNARVVLLFDSFPICFFKATVTVQQYPMLEILRWQLSVSFVSVALIFISASCILSPVCKAKYQGRRERLGM